MCPSSDLEESHGFFPLFEFDQNLRRAHPRLEVAGDDLTGFAIKRECGFSLTSPTSARCLSNERATEQWTEITTVRFEFREGPNGDERCLALLAIQAVSRRLCETLRISRPRISNKEGAIDSR